MTKIIKTKLDGNGKLVLDKIEKIRMLELTPLVKDPIKWGEITKLDTANLNKDFVVNFLKQNGLSFQQLKKITNWFPFYYTAFIIEIGNAVNKLGISEFKNQLKFLFMKNKIPDAVIDSIPDDINEDTDVGKLSDIFNPFTNIGYMLIYLEK